MITTQLDEFIQSIQEDFAKIPEDRKKVLQQLANFVSERKEQAAVNLVFICVHNSRRSHLSQFWAQVAAHYYGAYHVFCYSGGTEVTELNPAAAEAIRQSGAEVRLISHGKNPIYTLKYDQNARPVIGFSKLFDDSYNPQEKFAAIMVCSTADDNCPYIATADQRILIPFEDPKKYDGTPQQAAQYFERSKQIATEFFYAFSTLRK
ncbi:MAG: protein-tyrosine-phosphatase [Crocinitomicaceae bacterium]